MFDLKLCGDTHPGLRNTFARASGTDWFECVPPFVCAGDQLHQPNSRILASAGVGKRNLDQIRTAQLEGILPSDDCPVGDSTVPADLITALAGDCVDRLPLPLASLCGSSLERCSFSTWSTGGWPGDACFAEGSPAPSKSPRADCLPVVFGLFGIRVIGPRLYLYVADYPVDKDYV
jgi:hypothetical protein